MAQWVKDSVPAAEPDSLSISQDPYGGKLWKAETHSRKLFSDFQMRARSYKHTHTQIKVTDIFFKNKHLKMIRILLGVQP